MKHCHAACGIALATALAMVPFSAGAQSPAWPPAPAPQLQRVQSQRVVDPACFCWANGERFNRGETACLRTGSGRQLAMCDQVTNVMSWSFTQNTCPDS
jgi:hypothetical protein